jgi:hypothetical protein
MYTSKKVMQVWVIKALKVKQYPRRKMFVYNHFEYKFEVNTKIKPRGINTCCERSMENPLRASSSNVQ